MSRKTLHDYSILPLMTLNKYFHHHLSIFMFILMNFLTFHELSTSRVAYFSLKWDAKFFLLVLKHPRNLIWRSDFVIFIEINLTSYESSSQFLMFHVREENSSRDTFWKCLKCLLNSQIVKKNIANI